MIIICQKEGLMCNRLFHFSHLISFAMENNETIWYPFIGEFSIFFKNLNSVELKKRNIIIFSNPFIQIVLKVISSVLRKIPNCKYIYTAQADKEFDLSVLLIRKKRLIFLSGWLLRDSKSFNKNRNVIKHILQFNENVINESDLKLVLPRQNNAILIGLHIRRGDYINFLNGKFFFEIKDYKILIDKLFGIFSKSFRKISFIICTNDNDVCSSNLFNDNNIFHNRGSQIVDLCTLSKCDYIIGPPSTYSAWASFYGNVPLVHFESIDQVINLSDFKVVTI
jgi:hypothetical protein